MGRVREGLRGGLWLNRGAGPGSWRSARWVRCRTADRVGPWRQGSRVGALVKNSKAILRHRAAEGDQVEDPTHRTSPVVILSIRRFCHTEANVGGLPYEGVQRGRFLDVPEPSKLIGIDIARYCYKEYLHIEHHARMPDLEGRRTGPSHSSTRCRSTAPSSLGPSPRVVDLSEGPEPSRAPISGAPPRLDQ
jgi:hypothetical protein